MISHRAISWSLTCLLVMFCFAPGVLPCCAEESSDAASTQPEVLLTEAANALASADAALARATEAVQNAPPPTIADDGFSKYDALIAGLSIFVLAIFVGFEVITKVPPTLHTPLMSGSNAISGITLVGALLVAGQSDFASLLGVLAVIFAMINVIGGFWVTHRMLSMFKR